MPQQPEISRIWLTYKARMRAERRFKNYVLTAHLAISWYSFLLIAVGVYETQINTTYNTDIDPIALVLSVLVFGLYLIFYGFKYDEQAYKFRDCYL